MPYPARDPIATSRLISPAPQWRIGLRRGRQSGAFARRVAPVRPSDYLHALAKTRDGAQTIGAPQRRRRLHKANAMAPKRDASIQSIGRERAARREAKRSGQGRRRARSQIVGRGVGYMSEALREINLGLPFGLKPEDIWLRWREPCMRNREACVAATFRGRMPVLLAFAHTKESLPAGLGGRVVSALN